MNRSLLIDELNLSTQKVEKWKPIPGYEGIYEASTLGRIRSTDGKVTHSIRHGVRTWKQRILKPKYQKRRNSNLKDARVQLYKNKTSRTFLVARLIAMTWCSGYEDGLTVNHINGNPADNSTENLEWVTLAENIKHAFRTGLYHSAVKVKITNCQNGNTLNFNSESEASRFLGRNHGYIHLCLSKKRVVTDTHGNKYHVERNAQ